MADPVAGFDGNDYRKRVLAAVERRGGPAASDPFELYDLPPVDGLAEHEVAARVQEVWAFWQRQRDHPKYRVLVGQLVAGHAERSAELLDPGRRRIAAARVRAQREQRDAERYALLDAAISRLVDRHGAVPRDKVDGLHEVGALAGLTRDEVSTRLRRHRMTRPVAGRGPGGDRPRPPTPAADPARRVRPAHRGTGAADPARAARAARRAAVAEQIAARAAAWRSRARELPPGRLRAVVDELLVHVAELLEPGRAAVEAYLTAVAADVADHLRPRVRAAVLVEDRLVAEDHQQLLEEAVRARAGPGPGRRPCWPRSPPSWARRWRRPAAVAPAGAARSGGRTPGSRVGRAAAGRPGRAARRPPGRGGPAGRRGGGAGRDGRANPGPGAGRRGGGRAGAGRPALAGRRRLRGRPLGRRAGLDGCSARVRPARSRAARSASGPAADRTGACPRPVTAVRLPAGSVRVSWRGPAGAEFRVRCLQPDGRWRVVGRTRATEIEDGGAPAGPVGVYSVSAAGSDGDRSAEVRSDS